LSQSIIQLPNHPITNYKDHLDGEDSDPQRGSRTDRPARGEDEASRRHGRADEVGTGARREENQRLSRELDSMRARLASSDGIIAELSTLKEERDVIRTRVSDMLEQLEALSL